MCEIDECIGMDEGIKGVGEVIRRYRKKPVEIEAMQYRGNLHDVCKWVGDAASWTEDLGLTIETLEGKMIVNPLDYVIRGIEGEYYPCKPSIFEATYEVVR